MGWSGGCVPCKSRHWLFASSFWQGEEDLSAFPKNHSSPSPARERAQQDYCQPFPNLQDIPLYFGVYRQTSRRWSGLAGRSERGDQRLLCPLGHIHSSCSHHWGLFQVMEKSLVPVSGSVPAGQTRCPGVRDTSAATYRSNPSEGKRFEIRLTGERLP